MVRKSIPGRGKNPGEGLVPPNKERKDQGRWFPKEKIVGGVVVQVGNLKITKEKKPKNTQQGKKKS